MLKHLRSNFKLPFKIFYIDEKNGKLNHSKLMHVVHSFSDHRFIEFSLGRGNNTVRANTNWDIYDRLVSLSLGPLTCCRIGSISGLEAIVAKFTKVIVGAFDKAFPKRINRSRRTQPWLDWDLDSFRKGYGYFSIWRETSENGTHQNAWGHVGRKYSDGPYTVGMV